MRGSQDQNSKQTEASNAAPWGRQLRCERMAEWEDRAVATLMAAGWHGDVRELRNVVERTLVNAPRTGKIQVQHLGFERERTPLAGHGAGDTATSVSVVDASLDAISRRAAARVYALCKGNLADAARQLEVDVKTVRRLLQEPGTS